MDLHRGDESCVCICHHGWWGDWGAERAVGFAEGGEGDDYSSRRDRGGSDGFGDVRGCELALDYDQAGRWGEG